PGSTTEHLPRRPSAFARVRRSPRRPPRSEGGPGPMPDALRPYEVMIILDADLDEETTRAAVERWLTLIESNGAERGHVDFWGKRRLAYEINRKADGYYVVFQARSEPAPMVELHRVLSLADEVIRHKLPRLPATV